MLVIMPRLPKNTVIKKIMRTIVGSLLKYLASPPQTLYNMRSFIKKIILNGDTAKIQYHLPRPPDGKRTQEVGVLPTDTLGGSKMTFPQLFLSSPTAT